MPLARVIEQETLLAGVAAMFERRCHQLSGEELLEQAERLEDWIARKRADAQLAELVASGQLWAFIPEGESEPAEFVRAR